MIGTFIFAHRGQPIEIVARPWLDLEHNDPAILRGLDQCCQFFEKLVSGYHCQNSNLVAFSEEAKSESVTTLLTKFGATFPVEGRHGNRRPSLPASARLEIERRLETGERVTGEIVRQAQEGHAVRTDAFPRS